MSSTEDWVKSLWCSVLEMVVHQVLFVRQIYPQESFCPATFLGIRSKVNRHPEVVDYISQTIGLSVSAVATGDSNEIVLVLFDHGKNVDREKYTFYFENKLGKATSTREEVEREMREMLLSAQTLEGMKDPCWTPETSFRIMVLLTSETQSCTALTDAVSKGQWYCPCDSLSEARKSQRRRPVHHMGTRGCQFYAELDLAESHSP